MKSLLNLTHKTNWLTIIGFLVCTIHFQSTAHATNTNVIDSQLSYIQTGNSLLKSTVREIDVDAQKESTYEIFNRNQAEGLVATNDPCNCSKIFSLTEFSK